GPVRRRKGRRHTAQRPQGLLRAWRSPPTGGRRRRHAEGAAALSEGDCPGPGVPGSAQGRRAHLSAASADAPGEETAAVVPAAGSERGRARVRRWPHPPLPALARAALALRLATPLVATGCVVAPWVPAGGMYISTADHYTIDLPEGWMRWTRDEYDRLVVTRDGALLQLIAIERHRVDEPLKHPKK